MGLKLTIQLIGNNRKRDTETHKPSQLKHPPEAADENMCF